MDEVVSGLAEPAAIFDAHKAVLLVTNDAGRRLWGNGSERPNLQLDTGMPGLIELRKLPLEAEVASSPSRQLVFWTARGVLSAPCTVRALPEHFGAGTFLVTWLDTNTAVSAQPQAQPMLTSTRPASSTLAVRNIARRIQQEKAEPSATAASHVPDLAPEAKPMAAEQPSREAETRARLAHELRTPLAAVIALAEIMTEQHLGPLPNERYRGYLRDIRDSARHALSVVDGLLARDSAEKIELSFSQIDLNDAANSCVSAMQPLADKAGATVTAQLTEGMPHVVADVRCLKQILLNLLSNSVKYAGTGARITVRTGYEAAGRAWVEVLDTGPGIASDIVARVFQPASRVGRAAQQTPGLGLPLSQQLAEANGARLEITNGLEAGACVRLVFAKDRAIPV